MPHIQGFLTFLWAAIGGISMCVDSLWIDNLLHDSCQWSCFCVVIFSSSDVDECVLGANGCTQNCTNTVGSYTCSCTEGFSLAENGETCKGEKEYCVVVFVSNPKEQHCTIYMLFILFIWPWMFASLHCNTLSVHQISMSVVLVQTSANTTVATAVGPTPAAVAKVTLQVWRTTGTVLVRVHGLSITTKRKFACGHWCFKWVSMWLHYWV